MLFTGDHIVEVQPLISGRLDEDLSLDGARVLKDDLVVLNAVDFDEAEVDDRCLALDDWALEACGDLETDGRAIFDLNEEVSHVVTSLGRRNDDLEVDLFVGGVDDALDLTAALLHGDTLSDDVDKECLAAFAFRT